MAAADWMSRLTQALASLSVPVQALPPGAEDAPEDLPAGVITRQSGLLFLAPARPDVILSCPESVPGAENLLRLAARLAESLASSASHTDTVWTAYRRILEGSLQGAELETAAASFGLPASLPRCVLLLRMAPPQGNRTWETIRELVPMQNRDVLVEMSRAELALVKDLSDGETAEDVAQYALALQETVTGETGSSLVVGVGEAADTLSALGESMRQARRAIEIGQIYHPDDSLCIYSRMVLERLLTHVPKEVSEQYQRFLFNRKTAKLFDEEMLTTIDAFFHKDLNLSDTSRQLYIHRNTLVYRLDKVQRLTGLDLRSFDDAVTFKVLLELRRYAAAMDHNKK